MTPWAYVPHQVVKGGYILMVLACS